MKNYYPIVVSNKTKNSFTCKKCERTLLGRPQMYATAPESEGFKDVKLCVNCYWETVGFWNRDVERILETIRELIERLRDEHGKDKHADALRTKVEGIEQFLTEVL